MSRLTQRLILIAAATSVGCGVPPEDEPEAVQQDLILGGTQVGFGGPGGAIIAGTRHLTFTGSDKNVNILRHIGGNDWQRATIDRKTNHGSTLSHWEGFYTLIRVTDAGLFSMLRANTWDFSGWEGAGSSGPGGSCEYFNDPAVFLLSDVLHSFVSKRCNGNPVSVELWVLHPGAPPLGTRQFGGELTDVRSRESISVTRSGASNIEIFWIGTDGRLNVKKYIHPDGWTIPTIRNGNWNGVPHVVKIPSGWLMASRSTANIGPNQISIYTSTDAVNWSWRANSVHTTGRRPYVLQADDHWVEFSHVGTDGRMNINSLSF